MARFAGIRRCARACTSAPAAGTTGKIHGHVINPTGAPQTSGTVNLSTDGGRTTKFTFEVDAQGTYAGEAPAGTYTLIFRQKDTPPDKMVDSIAEREDHGRRGRER